LLSGGAANNEPKLQAPMSTLRSAESNYIDEEAASMPLNAETFVQLLKEAAIGSETGFRMRCVVAGHPSVATYEFTYLLGMLRKEGVIVACGKKHTPRRVVLSDIDDTVHPAHDAATVAVAGMDVTPLAHGEVYPQIEKVHCALRSECSNNRVSFPVFLSARPSAIARKSKPELQLLARKMADHDTPEGVQPAVHKTVSDANRPGELYCSILPGADDASGLAEAGLWILHQNLPTVQKGMIVPLGRKKIERVYDYARLFPELQYAFIGDDGQGDFEAARGLLELRRTVEGSGYSLLPAMADLFLDLDGEQPAAQDGGSMAAQASMAAAASVVDGVMSWFDRVLEGKDGYVERLEQDLQRRGSLDRKPEAKANLLFDFVAIKAVKTKKGFLFSREVRAERERLMQEFYGKARFFYFETYAELLPRLRQEGWVKPGEAA